MLSPEGGGLLSPEGAALLSSGWIFVRECSVKEWRDNKTGTGPIGILNNLSATGGGSIKRGTVSNTLSLD